MLATRPEPGSQLRENKTLVLQVSLGPTLVPVPGDLAGRSDEDAAAALEAAGLVAEIVPQADDEVDEGTVIGFARRRARRGSCRGGARSAWRCRRATTRSRSPTSRA